MKIGLVCPYNIAKKGGVQEHVLAVMAELRSRGHDAWIVTPRPPDYEDEPGDHIIFVGGSADFNSPMRTTVQVSASVNETIERMLEEERFDILHFHEPWMPMLSLQLLSRSTSVNVATFHAAIPDTVMSRSFVRAVGPYTKSVLKYIDAYTAVSDASAEYVCTLTDEPIAIIPNGVDTRRFTPPKTFKENRKHKTIFYVGRLEGRKGVKYLIRAFALLQARRPEISLVLASDGPDRDKLEALVDDLNLQNVTFTGYISDQEKIKYFQNSDLFCSPAIYGESFGIVLVEAMASGLVTVAGDNPGYAGVMSGLGAISLVHPKHTEEFARRLELLLYEKDLRKLWREWAQGELPNYTYQRITNEYEEVYKMALEQRKQHGS